MKQHIHRREFIRTSTVVSAGLGAWLGSGAALPAAEPAFKTKIKKALIFKVPTEANFQLLKEAGYDGCEASGPATVEEAAKARALGEKMGLKIHSVLRGWAEFNNPDQAKAEESFNVTVDAMKAAQAYGAETVLLVPCRLKGEVALPAPWDFDIELDDKTGHVVKVVKGDNAPYADYIKAQNQAIDSSREYVRRLIPIAEKLGVVVALENVWSNFWVKPNVFKHFVASFQSPWIRMYFDIGNHVKYGPPQEWINTLGNLMVKLHAKDFKVNRSSPRGGDFVNIREGDINWPAVRQALEKVGYNGWLTIEGGKCTPAEHSKRLDLIIAGQ